jgi:hypothetical protein
MTNEICTKISTYKKCTKSLSFEFGWKSNEEWGGGGGCHKSIIKIEQSYKCTHNWGQSCYLCLQKMFCMKLLAIKRTKSSKAHPNLSK